MIFGFLLTVLYVPGIAGAATTPRWALLAIGLPLLLTLGTDKSGRFTATHFFGTGFLIWAAISLSWTANRLDGTGELIKLAILALAFLAGLRSTTLFPTLSGMSLGLLASSICLLIQLQYPDIVQHATPSSGLFVNSGALAEISALVLIGLVFHRSWWLAAGLLPCIVLPLSRGAWLALAGAGLIWLWGKSRLWASALLAAGIIALAISLYGGLRVMSVMQRLGMWSDAVAGLSWLGHGIGSFYGDFSYLSYSLDIFDQRPEHLHNDGLEIVFEYGAVGIVLVAAMGIAACSAGRWRSRAGGLVLAGFAAEALVGFPLHVPCTAFLAALCLGHLARDGADIRDHFALGGSRLRRWHEWYRLSRLADRGLAAQRRHISV